MSTTAGSCGACRAAIDVSIAELDDHGRPICAACAGRATIETGEARSNAAITGAASTAALLGLASCAVGLYTAVPAVFVGAGALIAARTANRLAPGSVDSSIYLLAGFGVASGLLRVLSMCVAFGAI